MHALSRSPWCRRFRGNEAAVVVTIVLGQVRSGEAIFAPMFTLARREDESRPMMYELEWRRILDKLTGRSAKLGRQ
jgi:hypothetical protein